MRIPSRCFLVITSCAMAEPAFAHDSWISREKARDPESGAWCCNEHDCQMLSPDQVFQEKDGVIVVTTFFGEEHRFSVARSRVLPSQDGQYWACLSMEQASRGRGVHLGIRCFFAPLVQ
jgi:hypothetical protein